MDKVNFIMLFALLILFAVTVIYCWVLYSILRRIPRENQCFPDWFVWMFLVPIVGYIFQWIMLPFGIPKTLKKHCATRPDAIHATDVLFKFGLAQVIFTLLGLLTHKPIKYYFDIFSVACWIVYWYQIVDFKKKYL